MIRMCKQFFTKTLCIFGDMVNTAYKGNGEGNMHVGIERRGRKGPHNKTDVESLKEVKNHI